MRKAVQSGTSATAGTSDTTWQQLWFTLTRTEWGTLAVVPVDRGAAAIAVARALADAGRQYQTEAVEVIDAAQLAPGDVQKVLRGFDDHPADGRRVLVAVGAPLDEAPAIPIARATDAAVLLVHVGQTEIGRIRRTLSCIGDDRFAGSIAITA
jgi:hypothetical protein